MPCNPIIYYVNIRLSDLGPLEIVRFLRIVIAFTDFYRVFRNNFVFSQELQYFDNPPCQLWSAAIGCSEYELVVLRTLNSSCIDKRRMGCSGFGKKKLIFHEPPGMWKVLS